MTGTAEGPIDRARSDGRTRLLEAEAKELVASAGLRVPAYEVATTPREAVDAASRIGYPVVVKVSAPEIQHKSEWAGGKGVALDLSDKRAVRTAAERVLEAAERQGLRADVLVEQAIDTKQGVETIVGGLRDDSFGPVVLFGLGGTFTELIGDTSYRLAPVSTEEAREMLDDIEGTALLDGYRRAPAVDRDALAATVKSVGTLLTERDSIRELEVNPVLATASEDPVALDALVTLE